MEAYKNFQIAAYVYAYYLEKADEAEIQRGIDFFKQYIPLKKVYIENHRGFVDIPVEKLQAVKAVFEKNGIEKLSVEYGADVTYRLAVPSGRKIDDIISEFVGGNPALTFNETQYIEKNEI
jgi:hypothetical protein